MTAPELRELLRDVERVRIAKILETGATRQDVEIALAWGAGESDVMGEERKPLAGTAAQVYEILYAGEEDEEAGP